MLALLLLSGLIHCAYGHCTKANGVGRLCGMTLNQFTLAGSHHSGAGAYGTMRYWQDLPVIDCFNAHQDLSITQQLKLGIRYFDFDVAYITKDQVHKTSDDFWEEGIVITVEDSAGSNAYSRSLSTALHEIEEYMGKDKESLVMVRISHITDWAVTDVYNSLYEETAFLRSSSKVQLNPERNPMLHNAMDSNKRLFLFVNETIYGGQEGIHYLSQVNTEQYAAEGATFSCHDPDTFLTYFTNDIRSTSQHFQLQVDWYHSYGLCIEDLADLCNGWGPYRQLQYLNNHVIDGTGRPVNLILVDYVGRGDTRLAETVREMNEWNVQNFSW